jgi:hypothetical protein
VDISESGLRVVSEKPIAICIQVHEGGYWSSTMPNSCGPA